MAITWPQRLKQVFKIDIETCFSDHGEHDVGGELDESSDQVRQYVEAHELGGLDRGERHRGWWH